MKYPQKSKCQEKDQKNAIAPSLLTTGATKPVADATSVDRCTRTTISQDDSMQQALINCEEMENVFR